MARVYSSPGVYRNEIDLSDILIPGGISNGGIVVRAKKGPVNRPILVTNDKEYIQTFGEPIFLSGVNSTETSKIIPDYGYGSYAALEFLKESNRLYVVRGYTAADDRYANAVVTTTLTYTADSDGISGAAWAKGERLDSDDYISIIDEYAMTGAENTKFIVAALGPGTDGNSIAITIEPFNLSADWRFAYDPYPTVASATSTEYSATSAMTSTEMATYYPIASKVAKINVYSKSINVTWDSLYRTDSDRTNGRLYISPVETFYGSLDNTLKDGNGSSLFIESVINGNSNYIYVKKGASLAGNFSVITATSAGADPNGLLPYGYSEVSAGSEEYVKFVSTLTSATSLNRMLVLSGGASPVTATGLTGIDGWNIFEDRENVDVQILLGTSYDTTQKQEIGRIAATRSDCIAVVQAGTVDDDTTAEVKSREGYGYRTPSYVAIYGGYSKVYDNYNDKYVYLPNSIFGASLMARVDNIANPWDAPAGINRGTLSVIDQRKTFTFDEIGQLYDRNINVPRFIRGVGYVMWGQKTAQLKASALDRINVRRTLLFIENNVEVSLLPFVFENNTDRTRLRVFTIIDEFMASVLAGGGVNSYKVVCDESNNTPLVIDSNRLNVDIYVNPTKTIEFIQLNTIVTRTGISFEEIRLATA